MFKIFLLSTATPLPWTHAAAMAFLESDEFMRGWGAAIGADMRRAKR